MEEYAERGAGLDPWGEERRWGEEVEEIREMRVNSFQDHIEFEKVSFKVSLRAQLGSWPRLSMLRQRVVGSALLPFISKECCVHPAEQFSTPPVPTYKAGHTQQKEEPDRLYKPSRIDTPGESERHGPIVKEDASL